MQQTLIKVNPSSSWSWAWPSSAPACSISNSIVVDDDDDVVVVVVALVIVVNVIFVPLLVVAHADNIQLWSINVHLHIWGSLRLQVRFSGGSGWGLCKIIFMSNHTIVKVEAWLCCRWVWAGVPNMGGGDGGNQTPWRGCPPQSRPVPPIQKFFSPPNPMDS